MRTGVDPTSLTRLTGAGSALSKDMILLVLRGSAGRAAPGPAGVGVVEAIGG